MLSFQEVKLFKLNFFSIFAAIILDYNEYFFVCLFVTEVNLIRSLILTDTICHLLHKNKRLLSQIPNRTQRPDKKIFFKTINFS